MFSGIAPDPVFVSLQFKQFPCVNCAQLLYNAALNQHYYIYNVNSPRFRILPQACTFNGPWKAPRKRKHRYNSSSGQRWSANLSISTRFIWKTYSASPNYSITRNIVGKYFLNDISRPIRRMCSNMFAGFLLPVKPQEVANVDKFCFFSFNGSSNGSEEDTRVDNGKSGRISRKWLDGGIGNVLQCGLSPIPKIAGRKNCNLANALKGRLLLSEGFTLCCNLSLLPPPWSKFHLWRPAICAW